MVEFDELKQMSLRELEEEFQRARFDLLKLRLAVASRQSKETVKLKALRKYVAQIKTIKRMLKTESPKENPKSAVTT
ncbi:50S ribosomal protein L29 [Candidatus Peregrinibacteria bacterium]|nr:50S ribosomal protein L29 [Candidatus Peregrinibacteria bacterium]